MAYNNEASLLSVNIKTGRTHQIRLHLKSLGFHLIGEKEYFSGVIRKKAFLEAPRQMLHAWKTRFPHPQLGEETLVTAPLPNDMLTLLQTLHLPPPS
jgi:23S rRNA-/tRNA-specific pseudouridylate synthase